MIELFAVLTRTGVLKRRGHPKSVTTERGRQGPAIFEKLASAQRSAMADGDSVVRVTIDTSIEPVFIRRRKVPDGK